MKELFQEMCYGLIAALALFGVNWLIVHFLVEYSLLICVGGGLLVLYTLITCFTKRKSFDFDVAVMILLAWLLVVFFLKISVGIEWTKVFFGFDFVDQRVFLGWALYVGIAFYMLLTIAFLFFTINCCCDVFRYILGYIDDEYFLFDTGVMATLIFYVIFNVIYRFCL